MYENCKLCLRNRSLLQHIFGFYHVSQCHFNAQYVSHKDFCWSFSLFLILCSFWGSFTAFYIVYISRCIAHTTCAAVHLFYFEYSLPWLTCHCLFKNLWASVPTNTSPQFCLKHYLVASVCMFFPKHLRPDVHELNCHILKDDELYFISHL